MRFSEGDYDIRHWGCKNEKERFGRCSFGSEEGGDGRVDAVLVDGPIEPRQSYLCERLSVAEEQGYDNTADGCQNSRIYQQIQVEICRYLRKEQYQDCGCDEHHYRNYRRWRQNTN